MKLIPGYERTYIDEQGNVYKLYKEFTWRRGKILKVEPSLHKHGYHVVKTCRGKKEYVHKLMAFAFFGYKPVEGFHIDHINGIKTDNRLENLQVITARKNIAKGNFKNKVSVYTGVTVIPHAKKPYRAYINYKGVKVHLGYFEKELDAARAYQIACESLDKYINKTQFKEYVNSKL
jgi:hypothetical protein